MREIDVMHVGHPLAICCFEVEDAIVDPGPEASSHTLLDALGGELPPKILLTHIHLDHAGATGALVRRRPDVEVWVHERGAPHLVDPSKLIASATRLYGADMERLWGEIVPVPEQNVRVLRGGERIGPWRVEYTPGHASHHVSYLHEPSGTAFVGDVGGVRVDGGPVIPPTPPPDIDLGLWHASLETVSGWDPQRLAITHFGFFADVADQIAAMHDGLEHWAALAQELDAEAFTAAVVQEIRRTPDPAVAEALLDALPPENQYPGLARYWSKRNG